jgi:hypothetical protein
MMAISLLDDTLFTKNQACGFQAQSQVTAIEIYTNKLRYCVDNLYPEVRQLINIVSNKSGKIEVRFQDGSTSWVSARASFRGFTLTKLHLSELAKLANLSEEKGNEVIRGTIPAIPITGEITIESTPEGAYGPFYEIFKNAWDIKERNKDNPDFVLSTVEYAPFFFDISYDEMQLASLVDTDIIPIEQMEYNEDLNWANIQSECGWDDKTLSYYYMKYLSSNRDTNTLFQEYATNPMQGFLSSGTNFFPATLVSRYMNAVGEDKAVQRFTALPATGEIVPDSSGKVFIWEKPEQGIEYIIGVDTSDGLENGDYSVATILNTKTKVVAGMLVARIDRTELASILKLLGKYYNTALVGVENNNGGNYVNVELTRIGYQNLYFKTSIDTLTNQTAKSFGWTTSMQSRDFALQTLKKYFLNKDLTQWRKPLLNEMQTFIRSNKGKYEATSGNHDDCIMASAIAFSIMDIWQRDSVAFSPVNVHTGNYLESCFVD